MRFHPAAPLDGQRGGGRKTSDAVSRLLLKHNPAPVPLTLEGVRDTLGRILESYARTVQEIRVRRDAWPKVQAALLKHSTPVEPDGPPLPGWFNGIPIVLVDEQPRDVMFYPQDFEEKP